MCIKPVQEYSTDIKDILALCKADSFFISSWDKSEHVLNFDKSILSDSINDYSHINSYILSKDMGELKNIITKNFLCNDIQLNDKYFTIVSNGTSAAFISLVQLFKCEVINFLFIGPIYFTYYQILNIFKKNKFYLGIDLFSKNINIDLSNIEKEIENNNIEALVVTLPFFGSGISLELESIKKLIDLCDRKDVYLLIDYIYGNMKWNSQDYLHNYKLIDIVTKSKKCIMYESISKRIFLNGIKSSIIYSNDEIISKINQDSEICLGSLSYIQESLLNTIYNPINLSITTKSIKETLEYACNNYQLIRTMLMGTEILLSNANDGYFCLIAIPKYCFNNKEDKNIVSEIYEQCKIVTIPHSRYNYTKSGYYCFRINLVLETEKLLANIKKILNFYFN